MEIKKWRRPATPGLERNERGATATEYGVLMGFIAMIVVTGIGVFGTSVDAWFGRLATAVGGIL